MVPTMSDFAGAGTARDTAASAMDRVQLASLSAQRRRLPFPKRAAVAILLRRAPSLPQRADANCRHNSSATDIGRAGASSCCSGKECSAASSGRSGGDVPSENNTDCEGQLEMLFILRAKNDRDRWSGQVEFPASI